MENGNSPTPFIFITIVGIFVAAALVGCSNPLQSPDDANRTPYDDLLKNHERGDERALRVKVDAARNRLWVLGLQQVTVYDLNDQRLVRRLAMPAWSVAGIQCAPALILDRSGSAFISSNAEARLWKIDAADFSVNEYAIKLLGKENSDNGFGALAFSPDGTLFGLSSFAGTLWRIDVASSNASEVTPSERRLNACELTAPRV